MRAEPGLPALQRFRDFFQALPFGCDSKEQLGDGSGYH
jgi:hypothetical protein